MSSGDITGPGRELHAKFIALGDMTGKTWQEIIAVVGPPTSRSSMAQDQMLLQWQETGCHMAVLFDSTGRFVTITHEYAQYAPAPTGCMAVMSLLIVIMGIIATALFRLL